MPGPRPPLAARRRCAVLGAPIAHSLSPALHRAAYAQLGLDWSYDLVEVDEHGLAGFLDGLDASWRGLSLTMPLKQVALELVGSASETARRVGALNTVLLDEGTGARTGENTDVPGLVAALHERDAAAGSGPAAVLGGGATARSAVASLSAFTDALDVYVRTPERGAELVRTADAYGLRCTMHPWTDRAEALRRPLVVATTPRHVLDDLAPLVPVAAGLLLDVVYDPWPTALAAAWSAAGGTVASGLDLLVHQAALQVRLMTGQQVPVALLRAAGEQALAGRAART